MPTDARWPPPPRIPKDRGFLADAALRRAVRDGQAGIVVTVRLTSYRSLPLSCIEHIKIRLDGQDVDSAGLVLGVAGGAYRLRDVSRLADVWWFILDYAELFVPVPADLHDGPHEVEGTLVTVEPYMTAGRFSFHNSSQRTLQLEPGIARSVA